METCLKPIILNTLKPDEITLRNMCSEDLSEVVRIEQTAHISPWARLSFEESLTRGDICRVIVAHDEIVAFYVVSSVLDELHILNVVCAPKAQGLGLGHTLMQDIMLQAQQQKLTKLFLEVRASNHIAQSLYEKWGFQQIALRKQYYRPSITSADREDALVYLREL